MKQNVIKITTEIIKELVKKNPKLEKSRNRWSSGLLVEEINNITRVYSKANG